MDRIDAIRWLVYEFGLDNWPDAMDKYVTGRMFGNWRFVDTLPTREIMFCNMIDRGITLHEAMMAQCVSLQCETVH